MISEADIAFKKHPALLITILALISVSLSAAIASDRGAPDPKAILAADPAAGKLLAAAPFVLQRDYNCGPSSVAMVLKYYGITADAEAIAKRFETQAVAGTFTVDLLIAATNAGLEAHWVAGTLQSLRAELDAGRPAIVFLNQAPNPLPARHFCVAVGYLKYHGQNYVVLHTGDTPFRMVLERKFLREWKRTGYMMMTAAPKPAAGPGNGP